MLAKILVGVLAALLVSGAGVYYAFNDSCDKGCSDTTGVVSEGSCCTAKAPACCAGHEDEECTESKACSADAAGAFVGGAALNVKMSCKKGCCED